MTEDELRQEFLAFGQVEFVIVMNDKYMDSGQHRAYGFVEMASKSEGGAAVTSLNGITLGGRAIEVIEALPFSHNQDKRSFNNHINARFHRRR
jgi:RNA recognition motif-containing protein